MITMQKLWKIISFQNTWWDLGIHVSHITGVWLWWEDLSKLLRAWIFLLQKILGHPGSFTGQRNYNESPKQCSSSKCIRNCRESYVFDCKDQSSKIFEISWQLRANGCFSHNTQIIGGNWFIGFFRELTPTVRNHQIVVTLCFKNARGFFIGKLDYLQHKIFRALASQPVPALRLGCSLASASSAPPTREDATTISSDAARLKKTQIFSQPRIEHLVK